MTIIIIKIMIIIIIIIIITIMIIIIIITIIIIMIIIIIIMIIIIIIITIAHQCISHSPTLLLESPDCCSPEQSCSNRMSGCVFKLPRTDSSKTGSTRERCSWTRWQWRDVTKRRTGTVSSFKYFLLPGTFFKGCSFTSIKVNPDIVFVELIL